MKYSIEQLADLRCRLYEQEHQRELADRRAREAALQQNKGDITEKPKADTPAPANTNTTPKTTAKTQTFQLRKL